MNGATRNGTIQASISAGLVPFHPDREEVRQLALRLATNPSELAGLLVLMKQFGLDLITPEQSGRSLLDRGMDGNWIVPTRTKMEEQRQRRSPRKKKPWKVLPEHETWSLGVIPALSRNGSLLFVHIGAAPESLPETLHHDFAKFCHKRATAFVVVLDWGGVYGHEHIHAIVWTRDRAKFETGLGVWLSSQRIDRQAAKWKAVTGWRTFVRIGKRDGRWGLERHLANCVAYAEAPPDDGHVRDLKCHVLAHGVFAKPTRDFVRNAKRTRERSVSSCHECGKKLAEGSTRRRKWCSDACKLQHFRWRESVPDIAWVVRS